MTGPSQDSVPLFKVKSTAPRWGHHDLLLPSLPPKTHFLTGRDGQYGGTRTFCPQVRLIEF
jgi:hypothetical protein